MPRIPNTLAGVKLEVARLTKEYEAGDLTGDALGTEQVIREVTAAVARELKCLRTPVRVDMVAGQPLVKYPTVFNLEWVYAYKADGAKSRSIQPMTLDGMERWDNNRYRNATTMIKPWQNLDAEDIPRAVVQIDNNTLRLVPAPSSSRTNGIELTGWSEPAEDWTDSGDTSAFPLAPRFLPYVALHVTLRLMSEAGMDTGKIDAVTTDELSSLVADKTPAAGN